MSKMGMRKKTTAILALAALFLALVAALGMVLEGRAVLTNFTQKNLPPSWAHPFGTDWMGRDMFARTVCGLSMSLRIGIVTALASAMLALCLGTLAGTLGRAFDGAVAFVIDLCMGIPHILLLVLISFAVGKGFWGVAVGVALSHWMSLARVIRAETLQIRRSGYVAVARRLGKSSAYIVWRHMLPHLLPQLLVGFVLLFPHAILHEAGITFLGFGLPPEQPAIGILLSESMRYLVMGKWWLAVFPGLSLLFTVLLFDVMGKSVQTLTDPAGAHK